MAVALGALGLVTLVIAVFLLVLDANAHDFCDDTCNQGAITLGAVLFTVAAAASLIQIIAAVGGYRRLALGAFGTVFVIAAILFLPLIFA